MCVSPHLYEFSNIILQNKLMTPIHLVIMRNGLLGPLWAGAMHSTQRPAWGPPTVAECLGLNKLPRTQGHIISALMPH